MSSSSVVALPSAALFYKSGGSNKTYQVQIVKDGEVGYKVNFQFGRVGNALQAGSKTRVPVDYPTAIEIMGGVREKDGKVEYFGLVGEKMRKGYTPAEGGTPYQDTSNAGRVAGVLPQLLNPIDEADVETYLNDDAWILQEKKNGVRQLIKKIKKTVEGVNRKGLVVSLPETVVDSVKLVCGELDAILDGELVGEEYWLFDMLSISVHVVADKSYRERLNEIREWFTDADLDSPHFKMVPTAVGKSSKKALYKKLKAENAEGVVFKKLDAVYKAGRPASKGDQVKFKFLGSATVRCKHLNKVNSFKMEMLSKGEWVEVGDCTFFPTKTVPVPGKLYEVEYMNYMPGGSLYGPPVLLMERTDVDEDACGVSQLKIKQGTEEEEP